MEFKIRLAKKSDMPAVLELINELAAFEKEPNAVEVTVDQLEKYGFSEQALFKCFIAETDDEIVGMALFYPRFSTWKGETIHLEDLIVREQHRGEGIGKALLKAVIMYAQRHEIKRVEWVVLDWNTSAIKFYENYGAIVHKEWRTVQLNENEIRNFKA